MEHFDHTDAHQQKDDKQNDGYDYYNEINWNGKLKSRLETKSHWISVMCDRFISDDRTQISMRRNRLSHILNGLCWKSLLCHLRRIHYMETNWGLVNGLNEGKIMLLVICLTHQERVWYKGSLGAELSWPLFCATAEVRHEGLALWWMDGRCCALDGSCLYFLRKSEMEQTWQWIKTIRKTSSQTETAIEFNS